MAALLVLFGNRGLETAEANGDTRTLTLHHLHTDEDITITYKRDGRYDDDALKRLDHFLRDWRKDEQVHMDPRLFDVIWEVSREVGRDKVIQVVCGYRSPGTNAMLRRRSSGVAEFSQHTLGKAMDFFIPGVSLEETREVGLRLQRGGVGYYPTSGSPFVHLDVGNVRHWPRMSREQLVRVFPNGRTVHIPSDGQPLSGYALALADIQRRGSSPPSQMSLASAQSYGVDTSSVAAERPSRSVLGWLFQKDDDEDDKSPEYTAPSPARSRPDTRTADSRTERATDSRTDQSRAAPRPRTAAIAVTVSPATNGGGAPERRFSLASLGGAAELSPWPIPDPDSRGATGGRRSDSGDGDSRNPAMDPAKDQVPLDLKLAYAAEAVIGTSNGSGQTGGGRGAFLPISLAPESLSIDSRASNSLTSNSLTSASPTSRTAPRNPVAPFSVAQNLTVAPGLSKTPARGGPPALTVVAVTTVTAVAGTRYDDPWLRAAIMAPALSRAMTTVFYGERDFSDLRTLMDKPLAAVTMSFAGDPYAGPDTGSFKGEAAVTLPTVAFSPQTTWVRR